MKLSRLFPLALPLLLAGFIAGCNALPISDETKTETGNVSDISGQDDHGDTISTATLLDGNATASGTLDSSSDTDFFRFDLQAGTHVLYTTGTTDNFGEVFDASGQSLGSNDDGDEGLNFYLECIECQARTVYLAVTGFSGDTGSYTLVSEFTPSTGSGDTGTVTGQVVDATSGSGISSVLVSHTGSGVSTQTDVSGFFALQNVPTGIQTLNFFLSGFIATTQTVEVFGNQTTDIPSVALVPEITGGFRVVLTWGQNPSDLDLHALTPGGEHIYFSNRTGSGIALDTDDMSSFGPETVTISSVQAGTYTFFVHNYSGSSVTTLSDSGALVEVFDSTGLVRSIPVPSGSTSSENYWTVFGLTDGIVSVADTFGIAEPSPLSGGSGSATITVWSTADLAISFIDVSIDGSFVRRLTQAFSAGSPTCGEAHVTTTVTPGVHSVTAADGGGGVWGPVDISVADGECSMLELTN